MKQTAGLLVYRYRNSLEVLLVHPGGPFWVKKDAWGIPKGEYEEGEDSLTAAKREFEEEIGQPPPAGKLIDLGEAKTSGNKNIKVFAVEGNLDVSEIKSNTFPIEWPPGSGEKLEIPEVDKAAWLPAEQAAAKMHKGQPVFIERLAKKIGVKPMPKAEPPDQSSLF
jgi:predicted NUDIX family NTP pyrophosphohydrolase